MRCLPPIYGVSACHPEAWMTDARTHSGREAAAERALRKQSSSPGFSPRSFLLTSLPVLGGVWKESAVSRE